VLAARFVAVSLAVNLLHRVRPVARGAVPVLTWGGLRGAISVAMALALPPGPEREILLAATYMVVVFSIVVQGLTMKRMLASLDLEDEDAPP
jgi:CPA1 family monovalent cation:H+ antiporter